MNMKAFLFFLSALFLFSTTASADADGSLFCSEWNSGNMDDSGTLKVVTARVALIYNSGSPSGMYMWSGKKWEHVASGLTPKEVFRRALIAYGAADSKTVKLVNGWRGEGTHLVRYTRCLAGDGEVTYLFEYR